MSDQPFTAINQIGFTQLIQRLSAYKGAQVSESLSSDEPRSSILKADQLGDHGITTTSALFLEGIHFDLTYTPLGHLGYKMVQVLVSRLTAKLSVGKELTVAVATPNRYSVEMLEELFDGMHRVALENDIHIKVIEVTASHHALTMSLHLTGLVESNGPVLAGTSRPGDQICVSGDLGGAMAGLRILLREKSDWKKRNEPGAFKPELEQYEYVVRRQLLPKARVDLLHSIRHLGLVPTAMIELSQGLINDLQVMLSNSGYGCEIFLPAIPISLETRSVADEMKEDVDRYAFYGGEDYELLFTLKEEHVEPLRAEFEDFSVIGEIKNKGDDFTIHTGEGESLSVADIQSATR